MYKYKLAYPSRWVGEVAKCARDYCCNDLGIVNKPRLSYLAEMPEGDPGPAVATNAREINGFVCDASAIYLVLHSNDYSNLHQLVSTTCHETYHVYQLIKGLEVTEPPADEYAERMTRKIVLG